MPRHPASREESRVAWIVGHFGLIGGDDQLDLERFERWFSELPTNVLPRWARTNSRRARFKWDCRKLIKDHNDLCHQTESEIPNEEPADTRNSPPPK